MGFLNLESYGKSYCVFRSTQWHLKDINVHASTLYTVTYKADKNISDALQVQHQLQ